MKTENRSSILKKLGLTEEDVRDSEKLLQQIPPPPPPRSRKYECCRKEEQLLGYTVLRLSREKALKILGASEEDVDVENTKNLASLGRSGRRRSFIVEDVITKDRLRLGSCIQRKMSMNRRGIKSRNSKQHQGQRSFRRRSTGDVKRLKVIISRNEFSQLKKRHENANNEIVRLKQRLEILENELVSKQAS